ncbi:MAG: UDP-N-acetylmuramoyl-tripeptide--D-alanyl-D-alanine ligase [Thermodesulfovibrionia bacterium]
MAMKGLTLKEIVMAINGELLYGSVKGFSGVSIDSRTIKDGELFFAIKGDRFDGHDFLDDALKKGSGAVVSSPKVSPSPDRVVIKVKDTVRALQDLANFWRKRIGSRVVAITGSNGKTTTKEMTYKVLSKGFRVQRNEGNLNNHIGLPLSILKVEPDTEVIVLELGMNAKGEIRRLCEVALPDYGVITNIGTAHIGMLGGMESIRDAKLEILNGLNTLIINGDDEFLMDGVRGFSGRVITFSIRRESDVMATDIVKTDNGSMFRLRWMGNETPINLNVHGLFNIYNALAASAVGLAFGMDINDIRDALSHYHAFPMRFEIIRRKGLTIINDSYNANPSSMKEAINELIGLKKDNRAVAILGDMYELGEFSYEWHEDIGRFLSGAGIDVFVAIGEMMSVAGEVVSKGNRDVRVYRFKDVYEAERGIMDIIEPNDTILIKGSRAMGMERLVERLGDAL